MLEAQIPKDIRKFEAKLIGPFTGRQFGCFAGAVMISYGCNKLFGTMLGDLTLTMCSVFSLPLILIGWVKPYGMTFERFFKGAFVNTVLAPKKRKYKTMNYYSLAAASIEKMGTAEYKKRLKRERKLIREDNRYTAYR